MTPLSLSLRPQRGFTPLHCLCFNENVTLGEEMSSGDVFKLLCALPYDAFTKSDVRHKSHHLELLRS